MGRKVDILNVVPMKVYRIVRKMENDLLAAEQVIYNLGRMSPDMIEFSVSSGMDPDKTEQEMCDIINNISDRLRRIDTIVELVNDSPAEYINEEFMEGFIYGDNFSEY